MTVTHEKQDSRDEADGFPGRIIHNTDATSEYSMMGKVLAKLWDEKKI